MRGEGVISSRSAHTYCMSVLRHERSRTECRWHWMCCTSTHISLSGWCCLELGGGGEGKRRGRGGEGGGERRGRGRGGGRERNMTVKGQGEDGVKERKGLHTELTQDLLYFTLILQQLHCQG